MKKKLDNMRRPLSMNGGLDSAAEFVTPGHPDKSCDQIAGKILDAALKINKDAHVAIEMVACNGKVVIGGEVSPIILKEFSRNSFEEIRSMAKSVFSGLGYDPLFWDDEKKYYPYNVDVDFIINIQSSDINQGTEKAKGAGDQGVMCGYAMYAPDREHMPAAFWYSQQLAIKLFDVAIVKKTIRDLFADGKTQVIIKDGKISHVTIAIHHGKYWTDKPGELRNEIIRYVVDPVVSKVSSDKMSVTVNGTGVFEAGSIWADAAEVGRKIVIDQMGPDVPVGGGTLNGKDPSKVDFTAAVMSRYIAKNIVSHGLADEVFVQMAFTIGKPDPDLLIIDAKGWKLPEIKEVDWCNKYFAEVEGENKGKITVAGMIRQLGLNEPKGWTYEQAAKFGYYGNIIFPWEKNKDGIEFLHTH